MILSAETLPNLAKALWRIVRSVFRRQSVLADADVAIVRQARCRVCPHRVVDRHGLAQCAKCTCVIGLKTLVRPEKCPDGRWGQQTRLSTGL